MTMKHDFLDISDALKLVRDPLTDTQAPARVEQTVWQRITRSNQLVHSRGNTHVSVERYPSSVSHHVHKAKAYLPVDIAKALSVDPALVQKAAEIFYTRDAVQLRVRFGPYCLIPSHPLPRQRTR
jgi:hypothetical protein